MSPSSQVANTQEHTYMPWQVIPRETTPECCDFSLTVYDVHSLPRDEFVAEVHSLHDATFIVRACNSHGDLVRACDEAARYLLARNLGQPARDVADRLCHALKQATGQT